MIQCKAWYNIYLNCYVFSIAWWSAALLEILLGSDSYFTNNPPNDNTLKCVFVMMILKLCIRVLLQVKSRCEWLDLLKYVFCHNDVEMVYYWVLIQVEGVFLCYVECLFESCSRLRCVLCVMLNVHSSPAPG